MRGLHTVEMHETTLRLSVHRRVEPITSFLGKRAVRVTLAESVVEFKVKTAAAQEQWLNALAHRADPAPIYAAIPRGPVTRIRNSIVQALIDRSDVEDAASQLRASQESGVKNTTSNAKSRCAKHLLKCRTVNAKLNHDGGLSAHLPNYQTIYAQQLCSFPCEPRMKQPLSYILQVVRCIPVFSTIIDDRISEHTNGPARDDAYLSIEARAYRER